MESISVVAKFGHLKDLGKKHIYKDQFGHCPALKTIINRNCAFIQAKCFASITLFHAMITLSGAIVPLLQIKKKQQTNLKLCWDKELAKNCPLWHVGFKLMYPCLLNPEPRI